MLDTYITISRSLILLFRPFVEVVIHDLVSGTIVFIEGGLSERQIGDPSQLEPDIPAWIDDIEHQIYPKLGPDGRMIKSISIPIKDEEKIIALMCINFDGTPFVNLRNLADAVLSGVHNTQPLPLFKRDWHEKINQFIYDYCCQQKVTLESLTNQQKQELVRHLFEQEAFCEKNAVDYIARTLKMGRATIFNYLKKWRVTNDH